MPTLFDPRDHSDLERRLDSLAPDAPGRWGRMSAHQAVCHLADSFSVVLGDRDPGTVEVPWLVRSPVARFVALSLPFPWPKGVPTSPTVDQERGGTPPGEFAPDVARLRRLMERFVAAGGRGLGPHVVFGALSPGEWGRWGWRHVDHHLRQFGA